MQLSANPLRSSLLEGHQLNVLNEANEPEEEEDTYDDIRLRKLEEEKQSRAARKQA